MADGGAPRVEVVRFLRPTGLTAPRSEVSTLQVMTTAPGTLRHELDFEASPQAVYDALMDAEQHAEFTGMEAVIDWREGGRFFTCGERNFGFTLALVPGRRIVQAWAHRDWPAHHFSVVTFDLEPRDDGTTHLVFTQVGVPQSSMEWLDEGWRSTYWEPLRRYMRELETAA